VYVVYVLRITQLRRLGGEERKPRIGQAEGQSFKRGQVFSRKIPDPCEYVG